ncbi:hypothetical protein Y032_0006g2976 [Ancylostoma ceylanicum]|uniref:Bestrophin homolog n=1 Tax=Ancylostoma ceylanicum TaxID=53326 RepID=A0A016VPU3_9BILA|nr:hypothetical protein Y032_0006g2976 [Ancylostoma ceylanicum]
MTISYNLDVSSVSTFSFFKLLLRWRGSIWKSVKTELALWIIGYYIVFAVYRYALTPSQQRIFEKIAYNTNAKLDYIPLTFMLAFFVNIIADRWRKIFNNMGWIENCALSLNAVLKSDTNDAEARLMRRSIVRYLILSQILTFRDISMRVRRRFPDLSTIVSSGFMMDHELQMLESVEVANFNKYWVPVNWALTILSQAYRKHYVDNPPSLNLMIKEINEFRNGLAVLCNYDWVPIPIAYPQVVFLAVRCYFILCLVCRQYLVGDGAPKHTPIDLYVPFMTILQFLFFVAWMKVAEALLNPLGEDDDDFECNFLIDRNIAIGMAIVDQTSDKFPTMKMDVLSDRDLMYMNYEKYDEGGHALVGSVSSVTLPPTSADAWSRQGSHTSLSRRSTMTRVGKSGADGKKQNKDAPTSLSVPTDPSDPGILINSANSSMRRIPHPTSLPPVNEEVAGSQVRDEPR